MGLGLPEAAAIATLAGTGASLYGQSKQRKDVKKQNAQTREDDAWANLIAAAQGQRGPGMREANPLPIVDWGGALAQIGNSAATYGAGKVAAADKAQAADIAAEDKAWDNAFKMKGLENQAESASATQQYRNALAEDRAMQTGINASLRQQQLDQTKAYQDALAENGAFANRLRLEQSMKAPTVSPPSSAEQINALKLRAMQGDPAAVQQLKAYEAILGGGSGGGSGGVQVWR